MEDNKTKYSENDVVEWGGLINEFFWLCAGVNRKVLRQCPTDYAKYAGIGGTILFTALMAMLSGGYAMYFVFKSQPIAIIFGVFWGLLIFNLDRFIVNTMYSDGKHTISKEEFYGGLPRIIIAVFLGIVISTPLELKIYEKSINTEIKTMKQKKLNELLADDEAKLHELEDKQQQIENRSITSIGTDIITDAFSETKKEYDPLQAQYNKIQTDINILITQRRGISQITDSVRYNRITSQIYSLRRQQNQLKPRIDELSRKLSQESSNYRNLIEQNEKEKQTDLAGIKAEINVLKQKISEAENEYAPQLQDEFDGFQGRMEAFHNLQYDKRSNGEETPWLLLWLMDKDESINSTWWASFFIALLFIIIETAPTFFKMMIASGPYDDYLRAEMYKVRVLSDKRISDLNDEVNTEVQISTEKNRYRLEAEILANKELMDKITKTQAELLQIAIDKWREEELARIKENPSAYIKVNNQQS